MFDYGCIIWSRGSSSNVNRLTRLQKRTAGIILHADTMTPSANMFQELQWLPFPKRIQYHTYIMMFKALNGLMPDYLSNMFNDIRIQINLWSTDNDVLLVPFLRTSYSENYFAVTGAKLWNTLPFNLRLSSNLSTFKSSIKTYLSNHWSKLIFLSETLYD